MLGSLSVGSLESLNLGRNWPYRIYLPSGYDASKTHYPVLYLLHGRGGDETFWDEGLRVVDQLIAANKLPPLIAVAPAGGGSWWVDTLEPFETAMIRELLPHIASSYRTVQTREGRLLAGFSMGEYGALRYALNYPETFGAATILSPALFESTPPPGSSARSIGAFGFPFDEQLWTQLNYPASLRVCSASEYAVPLFIASGTYDWNEPADWHFNVEYKSVVLYEYLHRVMASPAQLHLRPGGHDWRFWSSVLAEGLGYMLDSVLRTTSIRFAKPPHGPSNAVSKHCNCC